MLPTDIAVLLKIAVSLCSKLPKIHYIVISTKAYSIEK